MTTEEKAKAYDEALERAKNIKFKILQSHLSTESCKAVSEYINEIIPELRESEDETIRKNIISFLESHVPDSPTSCIGKAQMINWLEKQKEQKPKMTPKWLYRLEFKDSSCGLWYDGSGKWCFESGIGSIDGCKTKMLPMDYDARYKQDGRDWFSSCSRKEDLMHWYSLEDAKELISKGFVFTRYLATEYHEYDQQTVFIKETALCREQIDIFELFGQKSAEWSEKDEKMRKDTLQSLECYQKMFTSERVIEDVKDEIFWLKSLHPLPNWKPSKEQMDALRNSAYGTHQNGDGSVLRGLYADLQRL